MKRKAENTKLVRHILGEFIGDAVKKSENKKNTVKNVLDRVIHRIVIRADINLKKTKAENTKVIRNILGECIGDAVKKSEN